MLDFLLITFLIIGFLSFILILTGVFISEHGEWIPVILIILWFIGLTIALVRYFPSE